MILRTSKGKGNGDEEEARYLLQAGGKCSKKREGGGCSQQCCLKADLARFHQNKQRNKYYSII